jgi:pyruvate dehydrogenase E2 component (dihydrolipoamide acetyltransferase)
MPDTALASEGKKGEVTVIELSRGARAAARRAAESRATIPHKRFTRTRSFTGGGCAAAPRLLLAAARALAASLELNSSYRDGALERFSRVNVGWVVHTDEGIVMPTVFDADRLGEAEATELLGELTAAAEAGTLTSPALAGTTCSLTVASSGPDALEPTIVPGHAAALAFGRPREESGELVATATLSCDERAVQLPAAGRFLDRLAEELGKPARSGGPET